MTDQLGIFNRRCSTFVQRNTKRVATAKQKTRRRCAPFRLPLSCCASSLSLFSSAGNMGRAEIPASKCIAKMFKEPKCPASTPARKDLKLPGLHKVTGQPVVLRGDLTPDEAWRVFDDYCKNLDASNMEPLESASWQLQLMVVKLSIRIPKRR